MTRLALVTPGADYSGVGLGKYAPFANPRASLRGAYVLGTKYSDSSLKDQSGLGQDLVAVGNPLVAAGSAFLSATGYYQLPFTDAALGLTNNAMSYVAVSKVQPGVGAGLVTPGTNAPQASLLADSGTNIYTAVSRDSSSTATADLSPGANSIAAVTVTAGGSGYTGDFMVSFGGSPSTAATGWAHVVAGAVVAIYVLNLGNGYSVPPSVNLSLGDGTGATATSTLTTAGDPGRGSRFEFTAATFSLAKTTLYRRFASMPTFETTVNTTAVTALGSPRPLHIGYVTDDSGAGFTGGTAEMCLAAVYNQELTPTEMNQVFLSAQKFLASCGTIL